MAKVEIYLRNGETISNSIQIEDQVGPIDVDFGVHTLKREGLREGDEVILDVRTESEPCVLTGGNPIELEVLDGLGWVTVIPLGTGTVEYRRLRDDCTIKPLDISPNNVLYWYSQSQKPATGGLVLRDHCEGFDQDNEPRATDVLNAISYALTTTWTNLSPQY